jgi:hypothetical protein
MSLTSARPVAQRCPTSGTVTWLFRLKGPKGSRPGAAKPKAWRAQTVIVAGVDVWSSLTDISIFATC